MIRLTENLNYFILCVYFFYLHEIQQVCLFHYHSQHGGMNETFQTPAKDSYGVESFLTSSAMVMKYLFL